MVVCKSCGYKGDNGKFCPQCGAPLEEEAVKEPVVTENEAVEETKEETKEEVQVAAEQKEPEKEEAPKKALNKNMIRKVAVAAIALIAVITLVRIFCGGKGGFDTRSKDAIAYDFVNGQINIFTTSGKLVEGPDCDYYTQQDVTLDNTKIVITDDDNRLYLLDKKGYVEVDTDVKNAVISTTGKGIAYIKDYKDGYGDLYLYNTSKGKSTKVESEVLASNYVISPDGKSVAYIDNDERCHLFVNGKEKGDSIKNAKPLAVSNGGKYFYYGKNDNIYVIPKRGEAEKLASDASEITFNEDFTQMLYSYNGKTYYCTKGKESDETVTTKGSCRIIIPNNAVAKSYYQTIYDYSGVSVTVLGKEDLSELVCRLDGGLYYINEDMSAEKIVSSYTQAQVSLDGKSVMYLKGGDLYEVKNLSKSLDAEEVESNINANSFVATDDLSRVYFYDYENEEIRVFNGKKVTTIYDDDYAAMYVIGDNLYFIGEYGNGEGKVFVSKNGGKKKQLSSSDAVSSYYLMNGKLFYYVAEDDELFMADGTKEKSVAEEYRDND